MKISILLPVLDRFDITREAFEHNLKMTFPTEHEIQFLIVDNGSKDKRVSEYFQNHPTHKPYYLRLNSKNEGCAKGFNQLFLRAQGEIIVNWGADNFLPQGWLDYSLSELLNLNNPGAVAISDGAPEMRGPGWMTGIFTMTRRCIETCGFYHDDFDVYGCEDLDFNERILRMGFDCKQLDKMCGSHEPHRPGDTEDYKKMKYRSFVFNSARLAKRQEQMKNGVVQKEPLPPMRDPL